METSGFFPMVILWFLGVLGEEKTLVSFLRKLFLRLFISFFVNYIAMSIVCLHGKLFNENRNHHQYAIGTALTSIVVHANDFVSWLINFREETRPHGFWCIAWSVKARERSLLEIGEGVFVNGVSTGRTLVR